MKKFIICSLALIATTLAAFTANAATGTARVYLNETGLIPGQTNIMWVMMESDYAWYSMQCDIKADNGLVVSPYASLSKTATAGVTCLPKIYDEDEEAEIDQWAMSYGKNTFDDGSIRLLIFSQSKDPRNNKKYSVPAGKYALIRFKVDVPADFTEGNITIFNANCPPVYDEGTSTPLADVTTKVYASQTLASIVADGTDESIYSPSEDLAVVKRANGDAYVTDGLGNWIKLAADESLQADLDKVDYIYSGTVVGTMSQANLNQVLTLRSAPMPALNNVNYEIKNYNLQGDGSPESWFKPAVNEVLNLRGWYFNDGQDGQPKLRGYNAEGYKRGQSADLDFSVVGENTLENGTLYNLQSLIAQIKEPWEAETSGAPARVKKSDDLAFQNYTLLVTELPAAGTVTGVDNITAQVGKVAVDGRTITVSGADNVAVYGIGGQLLSKQNVTTVEPGVYVVVANGKSTKVIVK